MSLNQSNKPFVGPALVGACLAVVTSVPVAAFLGSAAGDTYQMRALIYCGLLLWSVVGAVSIFCITYRSEKRQSLSAGYILLWFASAWLWPLLVVTHLIRSRPDRST